MRVKLSSANEMLNKAWSHAIGLGNRRLGNELYLFFRKELLHFGVLPAEPLGVLKTIYGENSRMYLAASKSGISAPAEPTILYTTFREVLLSIFKAPRASGEFKLTKPKLIGLLVANDDKSVMLLRRSKVYEQFSGKFTPDYAELIVGNIERELELDSPINQTVLKLMTRELIDQQINSKTKLGDRIDAETLVSFLVRS